MGCVLVTAWEDQSEIICWHSQHALGSSERDTLSPAAFFYVWQSSGLFDTEQSIYPSPLVVLQNWNVTLNWLNPSDSQHIWNAKLRKNYYVFPFFPSYLPNSAQRFIIHPVFTICFSPLLLPGLSLQTMGEQSWWIAGGSSCRHCTEHAATWAWQTHWHRDPDFSHLWTEPGLRDLFTLGKP